ncbi:hypothetical protein K2173_018752 [Erythroxylum novogranatense]|uniref:Uncharacterized protein n=1 Tax=Erythroxylum novogranatense TaxID=1862640 RepID=A0AAV8SAN3_9ROSI|nr:hypothetical protein K2173_018752 [Erythroxylum novogranatense]
MAPYEALYGRKCRTPICCTELSENKMIGPDIVKDTEVKIQIIQKRLKASSDRQKSYADLKRKDIEFQVGDKVFLKVSPWKHILRFRKKGKLSPRFIGPYEILKRVGLVAYQLALPGELARLHDVFHVQQDLSYEEGPISILAREVKQLRNKTVPLKATWEPEEIMKAQYPQLFGSAMMALWPTAGCLSAKLYRHYHQSLIPYEYSNSSRPSSESSLKCCCFKNQIPEQPTQSSHKQAFSILSSDVPWERGSIWSTMGLYMFNLHIPLGIGGLSIVSYIFQQPVLDPETKALGLFIIETLELVGALVLLTKTAKPGYNLTSLFKTNDLAKTRNWPLASVVGLGFLILLVFLTSFLADELIGTKDVNNPILNEILMKSDISKVACILIYCFITPLLEELIYRGFLLGSLASIMTWKQSVFLSSVVFSGAHFSGENCIQLFIIGSVLGCCYCWTGNLSSSLAIHCLYNAITLIITFLS